MLRLSKKADYALMAMKHLAVRPDAASASAREIAEAYDIPVELMAKVLQRLVRRGLLRLAPGHARRLPALAVDLDDLGRRHHPGDRRSPDGHGLLHRGGELRSVFQVQHPRPAVADQGPHRRRAGDLLAPGDVRRRARSRTPGLRSPSLSPDARDAPPRLSRLPRHHARRPACARGDAAVLLRRVRQPRQPAARIRLEGRGGGRGRARRRSPRSSAPRRARSSSRAARPNPTTWRSRAVPTRSARAATTSSPSRPSTSRCSIPASGSRRRAGASRASASTPTAWSISMARDAVTVETVLVSVMAANNEIGVLQPMAEIGAIAHEARRAPAHRRGAGRGQGADRRRRAWASICSR